MVKSIENKRSLLEIMVFGSPVLTQKAQNIQDIDQDISRLAQNMIYTMHAAPGIGLAAPQVNRSIRLITIDLSLGEKKDDVIILLNPEILTSEGEDILEEGCLSLPEINEKVARPSHVSVKGMDIAGNENTIEAGGLLARVLCHEIDHLNGKLFIDHLSPLKRNMIKKKILKQSEKDSLG